MQYAVAKVSRYANGQAKRFESIEIRELTETQAVNLSEVAVVIGLKPAFGGRVTVYEDRIARQALVSLEELRELAFKHSRRDGRNGIIS